MTKRHLAQDYMANLPESTEPKTRGSHAPVPQDVRKAIQFMRAAVCQPSLSLHSLADHCGVPQRTLNAHFRTFVGLSPIHYLRRLRLAAAREALLSGGSGISVTEVAKRYGFNHFGRFAEQYRRRFNESPSATLRSGRGAMLSEPTGMQHAGSRSRGSAPNGLCPFLGSRAKPSIAILLCHAPTHEPSLHWLAQTVAEATAVALSSVRSLAVLVPTSSRAALRDPQCAARELGACYFLTGRIAQVGARLRFIVRVADTATGHHVWGDSFEGQSAAPLELQDRIAAGVLRAILPSIRGAEIDRASRAPPRSLDAHGLAMRALPFLFASQPEAARRGLELLHRAVEIDPDYALATALAAWGHGQLVMYNATLVPSEERLRARQLIRRAAILNEDDPLVLTARCAVHTMTRDFDIAEALVARALALDPTCGWAWGRSAWLHSYRGNSDVAIKQFGRAVLLGSSSSKANDFVGIGSAHFNAGRYETAAAWLRSALLEQPGTVWANRSLSVSYARVGDRLKALQSLEALRRSCPDLTVSQVVDAVPFRSDFLDRLGNGLSELGLPP